MYAVQRVASGTPTAAIDTALQQHTDLAHKALVAADLT